MALRNCEDCNKLFDAYFSARRCQACLDQDEEFLQAVRVYVKANPGVSIEMVVEETGVPEERIKRFLRQGLLEGAGWDSAGYPCRRCARPIAKGEFCPVCLKTLSSSLAEHIPAPSAPEPAKEDSRVYSFVQHYRQRRGH